MMLNHVGQPDAAARVRRAVETLMRQENALTPDLGGKAQTETMVRTLCDLVAAADPKAAP
jgi:isocitrate/isopropylmalate dehydrogenase